MVNKKTTKISNIKDFAKYVFRHEKEGIKIAWKYNQDFINTSMLSFVVFFVAFWFYYLLLGDLVLGVVVYSLVMAVAWSYIVLRIKKEKKR